MTDAKISARYRELASEEPSALIDDAIRASARRAVAARRASFEKRWAAPISIAAVLVLAVGVTLRMQLEKPGLEVPTIDSAAPVASSMERAAPAPAAPVPAEADAGASASAKRAAPAVSAPAMRGPAAPERKVEIQEERRQKKDQGRLDENFAAQIAGAAAPAPAPKLEQKPVPVPFPAAPPASSVAARPVAPPVAHAPTVARAPLPDPAPPTADALRARQEVSGYIAPQPLAKAKEAEVDAAGEKALADKVAANVAAPGRPAAATIASTTAAASPAALAAPPPAKFAAGAARDSLSLAGERAASPEKELDRIAELRRAGRDAEADEALARFKREHPEYRIADEVWEKVRPR